MFTTHRAGLSLATLFALGTLAVSPLTAQISAVPQTMNFQGRLATPSGNPVPNGTYSIRFSLWNVASGGTAAANEKWNQTIAAVPVRNGTFAVPLDVSTGAADKFNGNLYLEIKIGADAALIPRTPLNTVPYAFKAGSVVDGSITSASIANGTLNLADFPANFFNTTAWLLGGNSATNPATQFLGTTDNQPIILKSNSRQVMRFADVVDAGNTYHAVNIIGGAAVNSIAPGVVGSVIAGGGQDSNSGSDSTNDIRGSFGFIGGGIGNFIDAYPYAVIGGGSGNIAQGIYTVIGGGIGNNTQAGSSVIAGGNSNYASGLYSAIGGGLSNQALATSAIVGGGEQNTAINQYAAVGGGWRNTASGLFATVSGGASNLASGEGSMIGGGDQNTASSQYVTLAGGYINTATGDYATIGGGDLNRTESINSTVGGGHSNKARGTYATVAGGFTNSALNSSATVGGGYQNGAAADYSTIPGGYQNRANGVGSFAAGVRAVANSSGCFVWADNQNADFFSTHANQFAIRASGGMMLETGADAFLYTASTAGEKNRYFLLLNSPQTVTASGLKAGGILCSDSYSYANPGKNDLVVKGTASVGFFGPGIYKLSVNGTVFAETGFVSGSDARWKTHVATFDNALDAILNLRGVSFNWKRSEFPDMNFADGRQIGFIAQEVEKILPELVSTDTNGYKSVAYSNVVPVLVEAVKAQQKQLNAKDKKIAEMEAKLNALAEAVAKLQNNSK